MAYPVRADPTAVVGRRVLAALIDGALIARARVPAHHVELRVPRDRRPRRCGAAVLRRVHRRAAAGLRGLQDVDDRVYFSDDGTDAGTALYWAATFAARRAAGVHRLDARQARHRHPRRAGGRSAAWVREGARAVAALDRRRLPLLHPRLVGFIVGLTTVGHRRVGDMVAKTFVV